MNYSSSTTIVANNNVYAIFQRKGVSLGFIVFIFVRFIIAIFGLLFNACLLYVTVNTYDLQGSCNFLIAFNAFCLVIFLPFMSTGVINHSFVPIQTCFWLQLVPMFFGSLFLISTLAIAIDRLLSVIVPAWHSCHNKEFNYLSSVLTLCMFYAVSNVYVCYISTTQISDPLLVLCLNPVDSRQGQIGTLLFVVSLGVASICIICYAIIWMVVRKNLSKWTGTFTVKILTSLSVQIFLMSFGYFLSLIIRLITPLLIFDETAFVVFGSSMFSVIAMSANAPVLYIFSTDYQHFADTLRAFSMLQQQQLEALHHHPSTE